MPYAFLPFEIKDVEGDSGFLGKVNGIIRPVVLQWKKIENNINALK